MNFPRFYQRSHSVLDKSKVIEGLAPLLLRLYLAPVMLQAGWNKYSHFADIVDWFGNPEYGLGLPFPALMAFLAMATELVGGALLLIGLVTRWISIPLMATMLVAALTVHWPNGWAAIADANSWLSNGTLFLNQAVVEAPEKLSMARSILEEHGNYDWLTSSGKFVVLNNGIEFAITYFIMLLSLFFTGGGKYTSVDYFLDKKLAE
ncbi:HvfX family Cu-binding RiPP maturation protein [Paraglaciecola sp.]|uniref:HvfX family Cu-binding RiPP maturation protein n=1 Tax=Paraglaciecola sp. TaxID=1920173 RepID=UPI003EF35DC0